MARMPFCFDEFDDDLDPEPEEIVVCPECGSDDLDIVDEFDEEGINEYICEDCGARFTDGEEEEE